VSAEKDDLGDGGWTLKAGALVLASGGMAMLDEFDKIDDEDRAALHEAMESAQISIAKAGMVAKFRTKTAILAAANPKWGRFDQNKNLADQFNIAPTLLSRFDLIFPIVDVLDEEKDSKLASHILKTHMGLETEDLNKRIVDHEFLRKYIAYARREIRPMLTSVASDHIKEFYVNLRRKGKDTGSVAITPRYLEGLVRLAEANAKIRLSETVEEKDAETAIKLLDFVMKQVMTDKETGTLDVDTIATGKPKSERDKLQKVDTVLEIIREMLKSNDSADIEAVIEEAAQYDIDSKNAKRILSELLRKGDIYEKEHGQVKIVGG
jgi:replicative DNA helicase Mcm